jgi:Predicted membrane protein (DUF2085)
MMLRIAFAAAALGWAAALPVATRIAAEPHASWPLSIAAVVVYRIGSLLCHQAPERSFHLWSMQMPVCARCSGIYAGAAAAVLFAAVVPERLRPGPAERAAVIGAALPTIATVAFEWAVGRTPPGWVRAVAGAPIGAVVAWLIVVGGRRAGMQTRRVR